MSHKNNAEENIDFIKDIKLFQNIPEADQKEIALVCTHQSYTTGQIVCQENEPADCMYIIKEGSIEVWWNYNKADEQTLLGSYDSGHIFGEMALLDNTSRSATVVAKTDLELMILHVDDFHAFLNKTPSLAKALLMMLSNVIRKSNNLFLSHFQEQNQKLSLAYDELKQAQRQMLRNERLANLGKLSSLIVHDIRNPISVIKCYVDLVLFHYDNAEQVKTYGQPLQNAVQRLEDISSDILDYSRGEITLNMALIRLVPFIQKIREHIESEITMEGISFEVNAPSEPVSFFADETKLIRAFVNLLDNSRKASQKGDSITVHVSNEKKLLRFEVVDTGKGMSDEILEHIFDPFYSASERGGYGLGMVTIQSIIESHGGKIIMNSKIGMGTTAIVSIPKQI